MAGEKPLKLRCPDCGDHTEVAIKVKTWAQLSLGEEIYSTSRELMWGEQSPCRCDECGWHGQVKDARKEAA